MASMIDYTVFKADIFIDTLKESTKLILQDYIDMCEARYVVMEVTDDNEDEIADMLAHFTYYEFVNNQSTQNTSLGNGQIESENLIAVKDLNKLLPAYNYAVLIFNQYVEQNQQLKIRNPFGI